jgi:hypothetical protein
MILKTVSNSIPYHGWQIEVVSEVEEFVFRCYHPILPDFCNDGCAYSSFRRALVAACYFVDREIAIRALIEVSEEWLLSGRISEEEYWNLTNFE